MYGISLINSGGYNDGRESKVFLNDSKQDLLKEIYFIYEKQWNELSSSGEITDGVDEFGEEKRTFEKFQEELLGDGYVLIQLSDHHIQYEFLSPDETLVKTKEERKTDKEPVSSEHTKYDTLVINAFGGPGAGKTTASWHIAAELKKLGYCVEYVSEYAKELVWDNRLDILDGSKENQKILLSEQQKRIDRLNGKVDMIVTDSPLLLNFLYMNEYDAGYKKEVLDAYNRYNNFNFVVERGEHFEERGRIHDLKESKKKDVQIKSFLKGNEIYFGTYDHEKIETLIRNIVDHYEKQKTNEIEKEMKGDDDMKLVISGKVAGANVSEVSTDTGKHKVINFTTFAYDPNAPMKQREDGTNYRAGIPLKCVAWDENADIVEEISKGKNNKILTASVTMRYNEYINKNSKKVVEPQYVIRKVDLDNDLHKQMSSLLACYEEGKINQIFEKEIQPSFASGPDIDVDIDGPEHELNREQEK